MKWYTVVPTFLIAFILQVTLFNMFTINGVAPNLVLCFALVITFLFGNEQRCIICATMAGLFLDFATGKYVGIYALTLFLITLGTLLYKHFFNNESKVSILPLAIAGTIAYHFLACIILAIGGESISFVRVIKFIPFAVIWDIILMYIMYFLMIKKAMERPGRSKRERYEII